MTIKLTSYSKKLFKRNNSKLCGLLNNGGFPVNNGEIDWEVRPGGMLVQKREGCKDGEVITVRISNGSTLHDISVRDTSTFEELKILVSMVIGLEPEAQRVLFRGKEREDDDHLHMVGVKDKDKVLVLEDPATKEMKLKINYIG